MPTEKVKLNYVFDNPNTREAIEELLRKIILEKLLSFNTLNQT